MKILWLLLTLFDQGHALESKEQIQLYLEESQKAISQEYSVDFTWTASPKESGPQVDKVNGKGEVKQEVKKSKGENRVAQMLRRQREKIKKMQESKKVNKASSSSGDWMQDKSQASKAWIDNKINDQKQWQIKKLSILKAWAKSKEEYKKELPELKKDLTDLNDFIKEDTKVVPPSVDTHIPDVKALQYSLIEEDFHLPVKKQGSRSTCAAFAAVRSMEILLRRQKKDWDLSEQYFYYASKPKCQSSPCVKKGSWPEPAFSRAIPLESQCPYKSFETKGNETQIPMAGSCRLGKVKVESYAKVNSRNEIQAALRRGIPVIGGFKLNDAFYKNNGHVFYKSSGSSQLVDKHAAGHALLMVGVLDLPQKLWATQGKHCTVVTNSWGDGWGLGGHACLSDKWFDEFRYPFDFLAVEQISLN